jgi:hypothetical protein
MQEERVMEPNDQEVDWREVAFLLNGVNEMLAEKIHKQDKEFARLQAQHKRMQASSLIIKNNLSQNN